MAQELRLQSGNINNFLNDMILEIIYQYNLDLLKDRNKQKQMEEELNNNIPIGKWNSVVSGNLIRLTLTSYDRRNKISWTF